MVGKIKKCTQISFFIQTSLHSKHFQLSYCAKVRVEAIEKKAEGGGGEEKRKCLPANPTIKTPLDISRFSSFVN